MKWGSQVRYAASENGEYPFFTCSRVPLKINSYSYDCECVLIAGNGDLNAKYYNGKFDAYQRTYIVESKDKDILDVKYLFLFLDGYIDVLRDQSIGGVIKYIKLENLTEAQIPIPPRSKQKHIVDVLDKVTNLITQSKRQIELMDELVKARFVEMFDTSKYPNVKTNEICYFITKGTTPPTEKIFAEPTENCIPFIKVYNLSFTGDLLFFQQPQYIPAEIHNIILSRSKVYPNDVLMNIVGPPLGKFSIVSDEYPEWNINQAIAIFRAKEKVLPQFLMYSLMQPYVLKPFLDQAVGIRQLNLSLEQCRNLEITLPPLELQQQFADFVEQTDKSKSQIAKSLEQLETLKKALMQKYFG